MKLFFRFLLVIFIILPLSQTLDAQSHSRRRSFYGDFFGGMTMSSMDMAGQNMYKKAKIGFQIGGNFNYRFDYNIELQTGFYLIKKGSLQNEEPEKYESGMLTVKDIKHTTDANYIQIPFNIGFSIPLSKAKNLYFSAHAGLFGAYGFKGDTKVKGYEGICSIDEYGVRGNLEIVQQYDSSEKTFSNTNLKRWDYGFNANVALVYDMYILQLQYDHGWANVATTSKGTEWKTRNWSLSLGFRF